MDQRKTLTIASDRWHLVWNQTVGLMVERSIGTESILRTLFTEAFDSCGARITAGTLYERLDTAGPLFEERRQHFDQGSEEAMHASMARYREYVGQCADYEQEHGEPPLMKAQL